MKRRRHSLALGLAALAALGACAASAGVVRTFPPGVYVTNRVFTAADEGTVWRAERPGTVRFVAPIVRLRAADFRPVTDEAVLARLPPEGRGKALVADVPDAPDAPPPPDIFNGAFVTDVRYGEHQQRDIGGAPFRPLMFVNHRWMRLARWPNDGFATFAKAKDVGKPGVAPDPGLRPGAFRFEGDRARRWRFDEGVWMNGFWSFDWDNYYLRAAALEEDAEGLAVRFAAANHYPLCCANGKTVRRFYALGLLDELDAPGEWHYDRRARRVYAIPPSGAAFGADDEIVLAFGDAPIVSGKGVRNVRFENLTFEYALGEAARFESAADVVFSGCTFANVGGNALVLRGDRNRVTRSRFAGIGGVCLDVDGGDRPSLRRADTTVEDCVFRDFGRIARAYAPAIRMEGCGITLRRCRISDAPHCGILYGGNEHLIDGCEICRVLQETADSGAIYTGKDWTSQGNVITNCFIHDLPRSAGMIGHTIGVYFDDCDCGDAVFGNRFERLELGILLGGGRDHPIRGNVFADCDTGLLIDARGIWWKGNVYFNEILPRRAEEMGCRREPWKSRYPHLARQFDESPQEPWYNTVEDNVFRGISQTVIKSGLDGALLEKLTIRGNVLEVPRGTDPKTRLSDKYARGFRIVETGEK